MNGEGGEPRGGHTLSRHRIGGVEVSGGGVRAGGGYTVADLQANLPRILSYVDVRSWYECWPWQRSGSKAGYGRVEINYHARSAHRLIWEAFNATILAPDVFACHVCDNPRCCNPRHVFPGTHAENMRDMAAKGRNYKARKRSHCRRGHPLRDDNLIVSSSGVRRCKICADARLSTYVRPRKLLKGRRRSECKRGHSFSDGNIIALPNGQRRCRECSLQHRRASYARKMERRRALCSHTDAEFRGDPS